MKAVICHMDAAQAGRRRETTLCRERVDVGPLGARLAGIGGRADARRRFRSPQFCPLPHCNFFPRLGGVRRLADSFPPFPSSQTERSTKNLCLGSLGPLLISCIMKQRSRGPPSVGRKRAHSRARIRRPQRRLGRGNDCTQGFPDHTTLTCRCLIESWQGVPKSSGRSACVSFPAAGTRLPLPRSTCSREAS